MKAVETLILSRISDPSGSTRECCIGRSVPPVTTTVIRGIAGSSSRAIVSELVKTVTSSRSVRRTSARAMAVVVVPTDEPVATDTEWRTAEQTIHHDTRYPSRLILPVIPGPPDETTDGGGS